VKRLIVFSAILLTALLAVSILISFWNCKNENQNVVKDFYVGVSFCGNTTKEAEMLVDKVKDYTNLFVIDSGPVSKNESMLTEISDYATSAGLKIIVTFGKFDLSWQLPWLDSAKQQWGDLFIGLYFFDEPAGSLLDNQTYTQYFRENHIDTNDKVANLFVYGWQTMPGLASAKALENPPKSFTSDYALYWFDYLAGYDVVLAEFGWNNTRAQEIALARGAARLQNKSWGVDITWTYNQQPYLENGDQFYNDMVLAYRSGAKYIMVFNYPNINSYGILKDEHFGALAKFWRYVQENPDSAQGSAQAVLVLPKNYGWGMRNPNDAIWGLWGPDEKSAQIWNISRALLGRYGTNLDMVYDDANFPFQGKYPVVYYWNSTLGNG
jgi:hypothetical protein